MLNKPPLTRSYDSFFSSHSPVTSLQRVGLTILGLGLVVMGVSPIAVVLYQISRSGPGLDLAKALLVLVVFCVCGPVAVFGMLHIRRGFRAAPSRARKIRASSGVR